TAESWFNLLGAYESRNSSTSPAKPQTVSVERGPRWREREGIPPYMGDPLDASGRLYFTQCRPLDRPLLGCEQYSAKISNIGHNSAVCVAIVRKLQGFQGEIPVFLRIFTVRGSNRVYFP